MRGLVPSIVWEAFGYLALGWSLPVIRPGVAPGPGGQGADPVAPSEEVLSVAGRPISLLQPAGRPTTKREPA